METVKRLYAPLRAKQRIRPEKGRTGRQEWRLRRKDGSPAGKNRQMSPARRGRQKCATGAPEGLKARGQSRRQPRKQPQKQHERNPLVRGGRPGPGQPAAGRARHRQRPVQGRGKNKNGRRGPAAGRKQKCSSRGGERGERAGPCAWRYSSPADRPVPAIASVRNDHEAQEQVDFSGVHRRPLEDRTPDPE